MAAAVMCEARRLNMGKRLSDRDIEAAIESAMWEPDYTRETVPILT